MAANGFAPAAPGEPNPAVADVAVRGVALAAAAVTPPLLTIAERGVVVHAVAAGVVVCFCFFLPLLLLLVQLEFDELRTKNNVDLSSIP